MKREDWKYTYEYLFRYANQVVVAIKDRIRRDKLIDTGDLLDSIDYEIKDEGGFQVVFKIGDGNFVYRSGLPSEYGVYQDQGTRYIDPHYFFTAPIPGLTQAIFLQKIEEAMARDVERYIQKQLKNA